MHNKNKPLFDGYTPYKGAAGGWGALAAVAHAVREEMEISGRTRALWYE